MYKILFIAITVILMFHGESFCQSTKINVDSLTIVYNQYPKDDTIKLNFLFELIQNSAKQNRDKAYQFAAEAKTLAAKMNNPIIIAKTNYRISNLYISDGKYDEAIILLDQAKPIFEKLKNVKNLGQLYGNLGLIAKSKKENQEAKLHFEKAISLFESSGDLNELNGAKDNLASILGLMGNYKKAIQIKDEIILYYEKNNDIGSMAKTIGSKSRYHFQAGEINLAVECLLQSLKINEKIGDLSGQLYNYQNLAVVYSEIDEPKKALEYAQKGLSLNEKVKNKKIQIGLNNVVCTIYSKLADHKNAIGCYQQVIKDFEASNNYIAAAENYAFIVGHLLEENQFSHVFKTYQNLITTYEKTKNTFRIPHEYYRIGDLILKMPDTSLVNVSISPQNRYSESMIYLKKGIAMSTELKDLHTQKVIQNTISQNYEAQGKYAEAYEAYKKYIVLKDSISGDEVQKKITRSEIQYEYDKKELALKYEKQLTDEQLGNQLLLTTQQKQALTLKEQALTLSNQEKDLSHLAFLKEQAEKQEKEQELALSTEREKTKEQDLALKNLELTAQQKQNLYLGGFIFLLLAGLGTLIYFYQTMRKQKNIIAQQNQLNEHTISILSHDIKEPLLGVKLLLKKLYVNDPFLSQASLSLENQINSVNGVLNNLLNMKKLSMTDHSKNPTSEVQDVVQSVVKQMQQAIQEKNITVQNLLPADFTLPIANEKLQVVVHNILSNAIKYSHPDQSIKIYKEGNGFCIQDFGVGLSDVQTVKMMTDVKNSKPGTTQEQGHGMGLYLVGMLLQSEQVKVIFESPEIGGTIVKIMS